MQHYVVKGVTTATSPDFKVELVDNFEHAKSVLDELTEDERGKLFRMYCRDCGSKDTNCQCWNDE